MKIKYLIITFLAGFVCMFSIIKTVIYLKEANKVPVVTTVTVSHSVFLPYDNLKRRIIENGDTLAYQMLKDSMRNDPNITDSLFLFYSLVMANSYQYRPAFDDVVNVLSSLRDSAVSNRLNIDSLISIYSERNVRQLKQ